jgi:hypothetical protein
MPLFGLGSLLGPNTPTAQPAAGQPAPDNSQSMNPVKRVQAKFQQGKGPKVSDVDLGDMGQPVPTAPMQG